MESFNSKWAVKASIPESDVIWYQSEIHVLASLLSDWSEHSQTLGWAGLEEQLLPEHFAVPEARFFYEVMISMRDRGLECGEGYQIFFEEAKKASSAKPGEVLKACLPFLEVTTANINYHARNILDGYLKREFEKAVKDVAENPNKETKARMMALNDSIEKLQKSGAFGDRKFVMLHHALDAFVDLLEERVANAQKGIVHLSSGFPSLDAKLKLGRGHFIVIGGRSGMGKTAFAFNMIQRMASKGNKIAFFTLEHTVMECLQNFAAIEALVPYARMDDGEFEGDDLDRIAECMRRFQSYSVAMANRPGSTIAEIKAELEEMRRKMDGLDAIFIDHMHVIGDDKNFKSPREKLIFITAQLKAIASYFDAPVIALAQMNRDADKRQDKRPQVSDLKESGSIEQDADAILFVYRDSYYASAQGSEPAKKSSMAQSAGYRQDSLPSGGSNPLSEIICRKNRHGSIDQFTLHLDFNPKLKKFTDATPVD
jgi:replicative DNA helicase